MTVGALGPGTTLARRYRLDDLLSEADGARFWRGTDTVLGRSVAVNVLPSTDPRAERALAAARASATVTEAHLLRVLDCDDHEGITWVVNEWGEGTSLDIMLQHGPLPASRAAWLTREVAEAIATAHDAGVAHGRLVPESVLVTHAGAVKLIGFAISAAIEGGAAEQAHRTDYGTLSPLEADVIDLAGVLYAALSARWPGIADSGVPRAPRDHRGPLRPRQVRAGVPRMLDALCSRVLREEAHDHALPVETAREVLAALDDHVGDPVSAAPLDVDGMYVEPTITLPRPDPMAGRPPGGDPEATRTHRRGGGADGAAPPHPPTEVAPPAGPPHAEEEQPAPLPPYAEDPERPLFASTSRRTPAADPSPRGSDDWLFGGATPATPATATPAPRSRRRTALFVVGGVLVLVVAMIAAFQLGRGDPEAAEPTSPPTAGDSPGAGGTVIPVVAVADFDPEGTGRGGRPDPEENPDQVPLATDGKPDTGWTTLSYASAALGGLKSGVGLRLDLGSDHPVGSVGVALTGAPTDLELYAAPAGVSNPPTGLAGMERVARTRARQQQVTLRIDESVRTRFLVLWLTRLPPHDGDFRGQIDEITVRS